ncbi:MAG: PPC domain-containing DNA-binding protein [Candidatus Promineifilaceae bacterium]|nr:PPC domain-containing DNA-binding protein [Candidatus Promineifilaceae bacterium]
MQTKLLNDDQEKTYAVIYDKGDEFIAELKRFAEKQGLSSARFTAVGAFSDIILQYFQRDKKEYKDIPVEEQVEVLTLTGDIALTPEGKPEVHAHVVLGKSDGTAIGGHIKQAHVWPTLELVLTEYPDYLQKRTDPETGLTLIDLDAHQVR